MRTLNTHCMNVNYMKVSAEHQYVCKHVINPRTYEKVCDKTIQSSYQRVTSIYKTISLPPPTDTFDVR